LEINNKIIIHHTTNLGKKIERERFTIKNCCARTKKAILLI
jgi:hypothetical protein